MNLSIRPGEGHPRHCSWCGSDLKTEPTAAPGETPCSRCGNHLWFTWENAADVLVIKPVGPKLELPSESGPHVPVVKPVVVDFGNVSQLVSADLARLLKLKMQLATTGGRMTLRDVQPSLMKVFRFARLDSIFVIEE